MAWTAKQDLSLAYQNDWTQVDVAGNVTGTPTEVTLEVHLSAGRTLSLRSANGGAELQAEASATSSGITSKQQVRVPLAGNRYFEYKLDGEDPSFKAFVVAHD